MQSSRSSVQVTLAEDDRLYSDINMADSREVRMDPTAPAFKKAVHELLAAKPLSSNLFDPTED